MRTSLRLGACLMALAIATAPANAISLINGLGGAAGYGELSQRPNDDESSPELNLGFSLTFFGKSYNTLFVNNNGNVTFGGSESAFTPAQFGSGAATRNPMIAPFWADVDTRSGNGGVYYSSTADRFIATWNDVGYFSNHGDKTNDFQLVLVNRQDTGVGNFDIEFRYNRIDWVTGDASGGQGGFGGTPAQAGYDATPYGEGSGYGGGGDTGYGGEGGYGGGGDNQASAVFSMSEFSTLVAGPGDEGPGSGGPGAAGDSVATFFSLPGSFTADIADLDITGNTGEQGYWKFQIRDGSIANGSTPDKPLDPTVYVDDGFQFNLEVTQPDVPVFIDPPVATGYRYTVTGGPLFATVQFTSDVGDGNGYLLVDALGNPINDAGGSNRILLNQVFTFTNPLSEFFVTEIAPTLLLDITSPTFAQAFVTGLTFNGTGSAVVTQAVSSRVDLPGPGAVPEPSTWAMLILGFGLVGCAVRRRERRTAIA